MTQKNHNPITAAIAEATGATEVVLGVVMRHLRRRDLVSGRASPGRPQAYTDPADVARLVLAMIGRRGVVAAATDLARNIELVAVVAGREQRLVDMLESLIAALIAGQEIGVVAMRLSVSTTWPCALLVLRFTDDTVRTVEFGHPAARGDKSPDEMAQLAVKFGLRPADGTEWGVVDLSGLRSVAEAIRARHPRVAEKKPGAAPFAMTLIEGSRVWAHASGPPLASLEPEETHELAQRELALLSVRRAALFLSTEHGIASQDIARAMILTGAELLTISPCDADDLRLASELADALRDALTEVLDFDLAPTSTTSKVN